jgi:hypothetical protein
MTRLYSIRLLERVIATRVIAFFAAYAAVIVAEPITHVHSLGNISPGTNGLIAGAAAIIQLVLSALVAPHVGDPSTPDLVPMSVLKRVGVKAGS